MKSSICLGFQEKKSYINCLSFFQIENQAHGIRTQLTRHFDGYFITFIVYIFIIFPRALRFPGEARSLIISRTFIFWPPPATTPPSTTIRLVVVGKKLRFPNFSDFQGQNVEVILECRQCHKYGIYTYGPIYLNAVYG